MILKTWAGSTIDTRDIRHTAAGWVLRWAAGWCRYALRWPHDKVPAAEQPYAGGPTLPPLDNRQIEEILREPLPVEPFGGLPERPDGWKFERVTFELYDTEIYKTEETTKLTFFIRPKPHRSWSNMYLSGCLPNPQAFLLQSIMFYGVTSDIALGAVELVIGNKIYGQWPLWRLAVRLKDARPEPLFIAPMRLFKVSVEWECAVKLGRGLSGWPRQYQPLQCVLRGRMARPVQ